MNPEHHPCETRHINIILQTFHPFGDENLRLPMSWHSSISVPSLVMETVIMYQHSSALSEGKWANWCVCVCVFGICLLSPWERCPVSSRLGWFYRSDLPASPCRSASLKALHGRIRNGSNLSRREYCNQTEPNLLNRRWNRLEFNATIYIYGYALFCVPGRDKYTYIMRYAYLLKRCRSV